MAIKICLDAGHFAKYNQSPANKKYYESDMTWKLHLLLKKYLEEYGFIVSQTRSDKNKDLGLTARGRKSAGCDLFLSLHSNALKNEVNDNVDYPLIIVPISGKGNEIGEKLAECVTEVMQTEDEGQVISKKGGGNYDYYSVIYGAVAVGTVGIIIEHSFHTNTRATNWLLNDSNLDKLAKAEAEVLAEHYGLKKIPAAENKSIVEGDIVSVASNAVYYNGKDIPDFVTARKWIVKSVNGDRAVIDKSVDGKYSINSPVNVKYLTAEAKGKTEFKPYLVEITAVGGLNIRKGPSTNNAVVKTLRGNELNGVYTIIEEAKGAGSTKGWGLLKAYSKSRNGWISLDFTEKA